MSGDAELRRLGEQLAGGLTQDGSERLERRLELIGAPGKRSSATVAAFARRDEAICQAREHWPTSDALLAALARFAGGPWLRERELAELPPRRSGRPEALLWEILRSRDFVLSARQIREIWRRTPTRNCAILVAMNTTAPIGEPTLGPRPGVTNRFVPSIEERLPPAAARKLTALRQDAADAHALLMTATRQAQETRSRRDSERRGLDQLLRPLHGEKPRREDDAEVLAAQRQIKLAEGELSRLGEIIEARRTGWDSAANLVKQIDFFLEGQRGRIPAFTGELPKPRKLQIPLEALADMRKRIAILRADRHQVESAPKPSSEAKATAREIVSRLAEQGAPSVGNLLEGGLEITWPRVSGISVVELVGVTGQGIVTHESSDAPSLLAWLFPDAVTKRLHDEID